MESGEAGVGGFGVFRATVWPVWLGAALADSTPPFSLAEPRNNGYARSPILWAPDETGEIVGRARIVLPAGLYTHWLFAMQPVRADVCGTTPIDFPMDLKVVTTVDVWPIRNSELALSKGGNVR